MRKGVKEEKLVGTQGARSEYLAQRQWIALTDCKRERMSRWGKLRQLALVRIKCNQSKKHAR